MALGGPSCLLTDDPQFQGPEAVGPFLKISDPDPTQVLAIHKIENTDTYQTTRFTFDVYSEDLGQPLVAYFVLDTGPFLVGGQSLGPFRQIAPGHLGSAVDGGQTPQRQIQPIDFQLPPGTSRGCHTLTLVVQRGLSAEVKTGVTWVVNADDVDHTNMLSGCPGSKQQPADAGGARVDGGGDG
jgi:hypothetical protein